MLFGASGLLLIILCSAVNTSTLLRLNTKIVIEGLSLLQSIPPTTPS